VSVVRVALPVSTQQLFEYWLPAGVDAPPGAVVNVHLARRRMAGVVVEVAQTASVDRERLLPVDEVVAQPPIPPDVLELCAFVASYYQAPPGLAHALAVPPLRAPRSARTASRAYALTAAGRSGIPGTLARAPVARSLFERLAASPAGIAPPELASLPASARRRLARWPELGWVEARTPVTDAGPPAVLNAAQSHACDAIVAALGRFAPFLLRGVTGSGKTEVYLAAARAALARGGQVLMLVPEIGLTPQLVARIARALPDARHVALHSALGGGERRASWEAAARGDADVVLGTRLAVFAPLPRLALVVVDEEHDASYKQQDGVRYHARDAAVWRARRRDVPIVLGSATPSLESFVHAEAGRYARLELPQRAGAGAALPAVRLVPARGRDVRDGLSSSLVAAIGERLARGEQSLVFVNRRGFSPALKCAACAWEAGCPRCSARLTAHRVPAALLCHHCGHRERIPPACPDCGNVDLLPAGHGTQRLEQTLAQRFPGARIARVDRDTTRQRGAFAAVRSRMEANELDILVGTQMLAKGHDFARLTLVGVLGADNALYSADFRATERLAALLMQVGGRAGRAERPGEVIVQTDFPGHPLFGALARHDHGAFASELVGERRASGLPPFTHLALVGAEAHRREDAERFLAEAHAIAQARCKALDADVDVFPPVAAPLARRAGLERAQMLMRSAQRADLQRVLTALREAMASAASRRVRWSIDVDPAALA
jgi:primosomal protein N' (replication factor Y)